MSIESGQIFRFYQPSSFEKTALKIFDFQYRNNPVYQKFCQLIQKSPENVQSIYDIPFMPVEFFKNHQVVSVKGPYEMIFKSSGTTGMQRSRHYVKDLSVYEQSFLNSFKLFYGLPSDYLILALLPSYLEREGSSLIYMTERLIKMAKPGSGFYLHDIDRLYEKLKEAESQGIKTLLFGVSFALWDFAEKYSMKLQNTIVMETGGMKGRRREPVREELHEILKKSFGVKAIHSEYGMTELLSQAYSQGEGRFNTPPWMKILIRDAEDPLSFLPEGKSGGINIIDLANIYSCSFLSTQDLGKMHADGSFEVLGRFDHSDIRGCNLLMLD